jgi:N-acetylneuraminic acid mutarotase
VKLRIGAAIAILALVPACGASDPFEGPADAAIYRGGLSLSSTSAIFSGNEGGANPPDQIITVSGTRAWSASSDQPWLTVTPSTGPAGSGTLVLHVNMSTQVGGWVGSPSIATAPSARTVHTAVWTGSEMLVWGGSTSFAPYVQENTGSRYDPVADSWQATASANAPGGRHAHSAVWTGGQMIAWGGWSNSFGFYGTGASYAPDTWFGSISSSGAPTAREGHSAVWTGSEMILWGGHDSGGVYNTGYTYDPVADGWTGSTSTVNSPSSRWEHAAVWTGKRMVVWGGRPNAPQSSSLNTGGLYDPATDTWTGTTTLSGSLSARSRPSAVWTGREVILWGGYDGTTFFNTGSRYDPVTNVWLGALPTAGAPSGRIGQSAVWTGSKMIVWGGQDSISNFLNTGGIYQPTIPGIGAHTAILTVTPSIGNPVSIAVALTVTP